MRSAWAPAQPRFILSSPIRGPCTDYCSGSAGFGLELIDVSVVEPPADVRRETPKCRPAQFTQANGMTTTEVSPDQLGPVDYLVVEFPAGASSFTGEMAAELRALVDSGAIRVIDVLILTKDAAGTVEATELSDFGALGKPQAIEADLGELLAADDVDHLAAAMEPGIPALESHADRARPAGAGDSPAARV